MVIGMAGPPFDSHLSIMRLRAAGRQSVQLRPRMHVEYLADRPELAAVLARWHFDEWTALYPDWSCEEALAELRSHGGRGCLPTTLVALDDDELLGSVSLVTDDLPGFEHLQPWLASLFVRPDRRGRGIGGFLLERTVAEARDLGVTRLYLFTPRHESYYAARGWQTIERATAGVTPVAVMSLPVRT
jgi:GNAT superfamily N-acetyltransferase